MSELVLALVVVVATSVHLLRFVRIAWHISLWNDELFSVVRTIGRGPVHAATHYYSANNHVFFNVVNALTPGAGSVDPARARLWSIVAVLSTQVVILVVFWRRRRFLVGAGLFGLFATNPDWLDLGLQARGYGFLGLAAVLSCAVVWRYLETAERRPLVALGVVTLAGTWTVPSYVLFAGPLWLGLLVAVRRREVLVGGVLSAMAIVAVYLPVLDGLRREAATYEEQWGRSYTSLDDVTATISAYLLRPSLFGDRVLGTGVILGVFLLVGLCACLAPLVSADRSLILVLVGAAAAFFVANLWLGTAVLRTTAFVAVPLGFAVAVLAAGVLGGAVASPSRRIGGFPAGRVISGALALALAVVLVLEGVGRPAGVYYQPVQDWQGVARHVERTFPDGTGVGSTQNANGLFRVTEYLDADRHPAAPADPDESEELAAGRTVLIDLANSEPSYDFTHVASVWAETRVNQRLGRYMRVLAAAPEDAHVARVLIDARPVDAVPLTDRRRLSGTALPRSGATVQIVPPPGQTTRSVVLVAEEHIRSVRSVSVVVDGRSEPVGWHDVSWSGPSYTVVVGDRRIDALEVEFHAAGSEGDEDRGPDLREVWTYPAA